ncbi:hypothetical protein CKAN_02623700 [Cinnamomum micranthum f. kanehirae]|uniref:ATP-dependent (S)-NAD(P)H-hydrate dehydratase n=1 Tax=Cinnamomum micranthum f. kanehirae TaxID=337451 RepID=A0A443Q1F2_9MAGN|nr:hypothetical protein CKAN_02623700 [Cinnamomum micranthum f. kanehirae]
MNPSHTLVKHDMNSQFFLDSANNCMLASSPIIRRQQFLIRSLCRYQNRNHMAETKPEDAIAADAEQFIRRITPSLDLNRHKGQAGKIAVIGGCREYTGAPYFAAISALKIGADLSHVFCTKDAGTVIKSYSPELIVHPVLEESYSVRDDEKVSVFRTVIAEVAKWMERFDCIVVGPGLGRDPFLLLYTVNLQGFRFLTFSLQDTVREIMKLARASSVPLVIDGDGLFLVTNNLDLVRGYPLAVLTPNVNEYKRLIQNVLDCEVNDQEAVQQLLSLARRIDGPTILRKGKGDLISDGDTFVLVNNDGSPRRCGGQGDILSGSVAVFSAWARQQASALNEDPSNSVQSPMVLGCMAGAVLLRKAAALAFANKKRATLTTDIIECLGISLEKICPASSGQT